jgi:hypothetical protein
VTVEAEAEAEQRVRQFTAAELAAYDGSQGVEVRSPPEGDPMHTNEGEASGGVWSRRAHTPLWAGGCVQTPSRVTTPVRCHQLP